MSSCEGVPRHPKSYRPQMLDILSPETLGNLNPKPSTHFKPGRGPGVVSDTIPLAPHTYIHIYIYIYFFRVYYVLIEARVSTPPLGCIGHPMTNIRLGLVGHHFPYRLTVPIKVYSAICLQNPVLNRIAYSDPLCTLDVVRLHGLISA